MRVETRSHLGTGHYFDKLLVESLNESFATILGEIPKRTLYHILETNHNIAANCIPERLNEFAIALEALFGVAPSKAIVRIIVKRLYSKLTLTYIERPEWRLSDYVSEARSRTTMFDAPKTRRFSIG